MKLVREYIEFNQMGFDREGPSHKNLDIGQMTRIDDWMFKHDFAKDDYRIKKDFSIDVFDDVNLVGYGMEELPDFIQFNKIYGGFYAGGNPWQSLRGFPNEIDGDLQINSAAAPSGYMKRFTEDEIRKKIKVNGKIYNI